MKRPTFNALKRAGISSFLRTQEAIAFDLDDSLIQTTPLLCEWYNREYRVPNGQAELSFESYFSIGHRYHEHWGMELVSMLAIMDRFHKEQAHAFTEHPGAAEALGRIKKHITHCHIVTLRSPQLHACTQLCTDRLFPGHFHSITTCGYTLQGTVPTQTKAEICADLGLKVIVEDSLSTALQCADSGMWVFLIDQPWNQILESKLHDHIVRVHDWSDVADLICASRRW